MVPTSIYDSLSQTTAASSSIYNSSTSIYSSLPVAARERVCGNIRYA
jgi:hypothetical protein